MLHQCSCGPELPQQALVKLLQSDIATDKDLLDNLQRSPKATAIDTVAGSREALAASVQSQRVIAKALSALVQLMEHHPEGTRVCRNRADEYLTQAGHNRQK